jgi:uncharacterized protein involved in exopolysaccharide biosynthesis
MTNLNEQNIWNEEADNLNLREFLHPYPKNWLFFLLTLAITLSCAFLYLRYSTPIYQITASLLVNDEKKGISGSQILEDLDLGGGSMLVENEIEILRSRVLIEKVIDELNLSVKYLVEGQIRDFEIWNYFGAPIN